MRRFLLLVALALPCATGTARAVEIQFVIDQVGPNVVATGTGSLPDLAGLTFFSNSPTSSLINPAGPNIRVGVAAIAPLYSGSFSISGPLGPNSTTFATSGTGQLFGFSGSFLVLPPSYVLGTPLNGTATWTNTTIAALGLSPSTSSTITWNSGARSLTITVVPEPSTFVTGLLSACAIAMALHRRSRNRMPRVSVNAFEEKGV